MKVRFIPEELLDVIKRLKSASLVGRSSVPISGEIGIFIGHGLIRIRSFNGMWSWVEVGCKELLPGPGNAIFLTIRLDSLKVIEAYLADGECEFDISGDMLKIGSCKINTIADRKEEDFIPAIPNLDDVSWHEIPRQISEVISVSAVDSDGGKTSVLYVHDSHVWAISRSVFTQSSFTADWEFTGFLPMPVQAIKSALACGEDASFVVAGDKIVLFANGVHIVTPQCGVHFDSILGREDLLMSGGRTVSSAGTTSSEIFREMGVAVIQAGDNSPAMNMWSSGEEQLSFWSSGSELGSNAGQVWSALKNFAFKGNPALMRRMIPRAEMWNMRTTRIADDESKIVLLVETEGGVRHYLHPIHMLNEDMEMMGLEVPDDD